MGDPAGITQPWLDALTGKEPEPSPPRPRTVGDLIAALSECDPDAPVTMRDSDVYETPIAGLIVDRATGAVQVAAP